MSKIDKISNFKCLTNNPYVFENYKSICFFPFNCWSFFKKKKRNYKRQWCIVLRANFG